ncbi:MAG: Trypsin-like peptidase domain [Blastocatellia bacterium]|jgi:hypothetical protein|nr:Trypsin-like peptidase domain [Blastocatellia bacterium]
MFLESAKLHFSTQAHVGGSSANKNAIMYGKGCWLSKTHLLTACHIWRQVRQEYDWLVAIRYDGLYKCAIVFESAEADLLLLKIDKKLADADLSIPQQYPPLSSRKSFLGQTVGYIASLKIPANENSGHTYFSMASVSMLMDGGQGVLRFALTGGLIQKGFSGGPVFEQNGDVVGILIQSLQFPLDPKDPRSSIAIVPIMSPVFPFRDVLL